MSRARRVWSGIVGACVAALVLVSCGYGMTDGVSSVEDRAATLHARVDSTEPGSITWWFEYGTATNYGSRSEGDRAFVTEPIPVSENIQGLAPDTTYHYRVCVVDTQDDEGSCGVDRVFTTDSPRDRIDGFVAVRQPLLTPREYQYEVNASTNPDGTEPFGQFRLLYDDPLAWPIIFNEIEGTVTCVRIVGNRAVVGVTTPDEDLIDDVAVLFFDNGPSGDSFQLAALPDPTDCPVPPAGPYGTVATYGNITITDLG